MTTARQGSHCQEKMKIFTIILFAIGLSSSALANVQSKVPSVDAAFLQKLSKMKHEQVERELAGMDPEPYIYHIMGLSAIWASKNDPKRTQVYLDIALSVAKLNELEEQQATILYFYAHFLDSHTRLADAIERISEAIEILKNGHNEELLKECLSLKANLQHRRGNYRASAMTHAELLKLATGEDDKLLWANSMCQMAQLHYKLGSPGDWKQALKVALAVFEKHEYPKGIADCLKALGHAASLEGDKKRAEKYYLEASEKYKEAGDAHGQANCLYNLGVLFQGQELFEKSIAYLQEAVAAYTRSSSLTGVGIANMEIGHSYFSSGDLAKAETHLVTAQKLLTQSGNLRRLAQTEDYLGNVKEAQGEIQESIQHRRKSVAHYEELDRHKKATSIRTLLEAENITEPEQTPDVSYDK
jgi:tetratricopeptide (TPR) repeat protein